MGKDTEDFSGFLRSLEGIEDKRRQESVRHSVAEIFLVTLCGVVCGANNWEDIALFGEAKMDVLREWLPYKEGPPCKDTIRRFFRSLDHKAFQERFVGWMRRLHPVVSETIIAIDGKTSRHSFDGEAPPLHLLSAFACEARLVLGQQVVDGKSNEITAIPDLLKLLALEGAIVTIDAMGCQYKIADTIKGRHGEYVLALKGNQGTLHEDVKTFLSDKEVLNNSPTCTETDGGHGRIETRTCTVSDDVAWLRERHPAWQTLQTLVRLDSAREIGGCTVKETRYFLSSLPPDPQKILRAVRAHWAIENTLHWSLDMTFADDAGRTRKDHAPANLTTFRHFALNLLQKHKPKRGSIAGFRKKIGWDNAILRNIISNAFVI